MMLGCSPSHPVSPILRHPVLVLGLLAASLLGCGDDDGNTNQANQNGNVNENLNENSNTNANTNGGLEVRDCLYTIRLEHETASSVHLAGTFNGWDPSAWPLQRSGSTWEIRVTTNPASPAVDAKVIDPGEHQYKLVVDGSQWWLDVANPLTRFDDEQANENSLLVAEDCRAPEITLEDVRVDHPAGEIALSLNVKDGAQANGLESVDATMNGARLPSGNVAATLGTGAVSIVVDGLPTGKHTFEIAVEERGGQRALLRAPVWMEPRYRNWQDLVVYNIMVDRFANGDTSNDDPAGVEYLIDWHGGDWAGILQKLQDGFFDELGVSALWISTPNDNPDTVHPGDCGRSYSAYHTYWVQSAREVENHFGTSDDLKALVAEAHRRGIRVMVDWAGNHIFLDHPLHLAHQGDASWFNYPATTDQEQLWQNKCGVIGWNEYALECWFTEYLPDYNHRNHELVQRLTDDALWWIREYDLDGFRVDATKHIRPSYLRYLRYRIDREVATWYTPFYMVGENFIYDYGLIGANISQHELQGQFDFPLYGSIRWAFGDAQTHFDSLNTFVYQSFIDDQAIAHVDWAAEGYTDHDILMGIFLGNHDVTRFSSHAAGQEDPNDVVCQVYNSGSPPQPTDPAIYHRMRLAFTFLFTVRGLPVIYYGDEIGLAGVHDPDNRRDMVFDTSGLLPAQLELRAAVARLGHLRHEHPALRTGRYDAFWGDPACWAYAKADASETVLVILSGDQGCTMDLPIKAGYGLVDGDVLEDRMVEQGGATYTISGMTIPVSMGPWSAQILVMR